MPNESDITKEFVFTWCIETYSMCCSVPGKIFRSPEFTIDNIDSNISLYLDLYPSGRNENDAFVSCSLSGDYEDSILELNGRIAILDENSEVLVVREGLEAWNQIIKIHKLANVMASWKEDSLTIVCYIRGNVTTVEVANGCTGRSKIIVDRCFFHWEIRCPIDDNENHRKSVFFSDQISLQYTFLILKDVWAICISLLNNDYTQQLLSCRIAIMDVYGQEWKSSKASYVFKNSTDIWLFPLHYDLSKMNELYDNCLINGVFTLTISNEISKFQYYDEEVKYSYGSTISDNLLVLRQDFRNMFTSKKHSDVRIRGKVTSVEAHKCILAARSPVFSKKFEQENQNDIFIDLDKNLLKSFLEFIYVGKISDMCYKTAAKLAIVGVEYEISALKSKCCKYLERVLSSKNACEIIILADSVGHELLKKLAIDCIVKNASTVLLSNEWLVFVKNNNELATMVYSKLSSSYCTVENKS